MNNLKRMIELQEEINIIAAGKNWKDRKLDWDLAILQESAELIDSFPWKWWKKCSYDFDNAAIEIVDIWHFILSKMAEENIKPTTILNEQFSVLSSIRKSESSSIILFIKELIVETLTGKDSVSLASILMSISGKIGMDYEKLTKMYFGKNVLNKFRQANGYKTGEYTKNWNGSEDNVALMHIINRVQLDKNFEDELYSALSEEYAMVK